MADSVKIDIDKKGLLDIKSGLDKLYPTNSKMNRALLTSLKRAAKPIQANLKNLIQSKANRSKNNTGKLKRSIKIFPSKRLTKQGRPSVFVGPIVRVPKRITAKKGMTKSEKKSAAEAYIKKKSGFYFYFLEYGFKPGKSNNKVNGLGLLPKATNASAPQAMALVEKEILNTLNKRSMKLFGTGIK